MTPVRPPAAQLRRRFDEVASSPAIGGSLVLQGLSRLAAACIDGTSEGNDAVAFAFAVVLLLHSMDRDERPVTGADNFQLMAMGGTEWFAEAVAFIESGSDKDKALGIVAELTRLTPNRLYGRWPSDGV